MLRQFHSELGEQPRKGVIIAHYGVLTGKYKLYSNIEIKGQGIKLDDATGNTNRYKRPSYWVTKKAFERLCKIYEIDQNLLFD